jgi:hypothetical protein
VFSVKYELNRFINIFMCIKCGCILASKSLGYFNIQLVRVAVVVVVVVFLLIVVVMVMILVVLIMAEAAVDLNSA